MKASEECLSGNVERFWSCVVGAVLDCWLLTDDGGGGYCS